MKVLTAKDLQERGIRWSRQHRDRMVKAGEFPKPLKLGTGPKSWNVWLETEVNQWLEQRAAARQAPMVRKGASAA